MALNIVFHLHIEKGRTDQGTLVNSVLQAEVLTSTAEVQSIMLVLQ
jgi:hypothetical protein